jgi:hypothetical protein
LRNRHEILTRNILEIGRGCSLHHISEYILYNSRGVRWGLTHSVVEEGLNKLWERIQADKINLYNRLYSFQVLKRNSYIWNSSKTTQRKWGETVPTGTLYPLRMWTSFSGSINRIFNVSYNFQLYLGLQR